MWLYQDSPFDGDLKDYVGFVYIITNLTNNKKYIGKKNFYFSRTKQVNKKKKKIKVPSDWETYYGSNDALNKDVESLGADNFRREILRLCKSKSEFGYYEAKLQFEHNVLESDDYYNSWIMCRINKKHLTFLKK